MYTVNLMVIFLEQLCIIQKEYKRNLQNYFEGLSSLEHKCSENYCHTPGMRIIDSGIVDVRRWKL